MPTCIYPLFLLCMPLVQYAQAKKTLLQKNRFADSTTAASVREEQLYELPVISLNETERSENPAVSPPSLLSANRDVLLSMAAFHFSVMRFRVRGYGPDLFHTMVNGIQMNDPDNGNTQWGLWSGLNEVTRNGQLVRGLTVSEYGFGNLGGLTSTDLRASKQTARTEIGYTISNRTFTHKWSFVKTVGFTRKGWAYATAGSLRKGEEGYYPGTMYDGLSYYVAADKKLSEDHLLSVIFFGARTVNGRQAAVLQESVAITGNHAYNPNWGYQHGRKRNAGLSFSHLPVCLITHTYRINNQSRLVASLGGTWGEKSSSGLDWYQAADPRPDYYRYLPSYQQDAAVSSLVRESLRQQESLQQINWQHLYNVNRNSFEIFRDAGGIKGNDVAGLRSHYFLAEKVTQIKRLELSAILDTRLNKKISMTGGISAQYQHSRYFARVSDLLGGEYAADINAFAEDPAASDTKRAQNDLRHPNRILYAGDVYGYDYAVITGMTKGFIQCQVTTARADLFAALEISARGYYRDGRMQNGLFPFQSLGSSELLSFTNYGLKTGLTHKFSGRKYLYMQAAVANRAPLFENVFVAPRTRDTRQEGTRNEALAHVESGYIWNAPSIKMRWTAYITSFRNGMNVLTFYHDGYRQFVNYAVNGIGKTHMGIETGTELKLTGRWQLMLAASAGGFYYDTRQQVAVSSDNDAYVLEKAIVYAKNFRVEGTPQEAYGMGFSYQGATVYANLTGSYFRRHWLAWVPLRRTYAILENVTAGSEQWYRIIRQQVLPEQLVLDFSAGGSFRLRKPGHTQQKQLSWQLSLNNLLNRRDMIAGGYESLRFDTAAKNPDTFPPKYYYAMGLNFSLHLSVRF